MLMAVVAKFPKDRAKRRRRRLKSLAFVPTALTLGNLICGFAAIHFALRAVFELGTGTVAESASTLPRSLVELMLPSFLSIGAGLVILGMVFDCFDGLVARVTRSTTDFGGQLDSLADVVSFGVAPGVLMVAFMTTQLTHEVIPSPISENFVGRFSWVAAALYVAFTAVRLARFNVEHAKADFDYRSFRGLPSPGAAGVMVALIIFHEQAAQPIRPFIVYGIPVVALLTAFLMVSRIPYKRFHRAYLVGRRPFGHFVILVVIAATFFMYKAPTLLVLVLWYWASGPVTYFYHRLRQRHVSPKPDSGQSEAGTQQTA